MHWASPEERRALGQARRKQVGERLEARYTMDAERGLAKSEQPTDKAATDTNDMDGVELF